jgi:tRNA1(Val) A37 N6-methylase TrmN6
MRSRRLDAEPAPTSDDAVLGGRLRLLQPARGHRAGHDAILLAAAAPNAKHAIDLGAGVGTTGLALLARGAAEKVTLVEIEPALAELARRNAERNGYAARADIVIADVAKLGRGAPRPASADAVLANPPFNDPTRRRASPDAARRRAHEAHESDLDTWVRAADRLLKPAGTFVLIHRPEALAAILRALELRFGAAELIPIHPKPGVPAIRLIVRAIKGRRTPPVLSPGLVLADAAGRSSAEAEAILRDAGPLGPA